ncbi:hypothetical protein B4064_3843 [Caldibacillus thermoamylovorans]|nr:hypothetical protein B4064_3843 [Caldibacillus thermoamylovorans]KIO56662.1 hypothetical protein B4065_3822 [Caldibacillus thermoamylovorans]
MKPDLNPGICECPYCLYLTYEELKQGTLLFIYLILNQFISYL